MRKQLSLLLAGAMLCALVSCAEAPENTIVAKKNTERLVEAAAAEPEEETTLAGTAETAPEHYTWAYENDAKTVKVTVDSDISLPKGDSIPMYRVSSGELDQSVLNTLYHCFFPEGNTWRIENAVATKAYYESEIIAIKQNISDYENRVNTDGLSEEEIAKAIEGFQQDLAMMEEQYQSAPEESKAEQVPADATLVDWVDEDTGAAMQYAFCMDDNATFDARSAMSDSDWGSSISYEREDAPRYHAKAGTPINPQDAEQYADEIGLTLANAETMAQAALDAAGIETKLDHIYALRVSENVPEGEEFSADGKFGGYELHYVRAVDGVPLADSNYARLNDDEYVGIWEDESIVICVNAQGILSMQWKAPLTMGDTVSENVGLIPFEDAKSIFEQMVPLIREGNTEKAPDEQIGLQELMVDRVELRLIRVRDSGETRTGLLTPSWVFYGTEIDHINALDQETGQWKEWGTGRPREELVLAINAVDGSIIEY